jgi:cytochrome P450
MAYEGFGYEFAALKDDSNPVAAAFFDIFDNSPETLLIVVFLALYPEARNLPIPAIQAGEKAKAVIDTAARLIIENRLDEKTLDKDILGCMLRENSRLEAMGEDGLSKEEILDQIFTFLAAGYFILVVLMKT